MTGTISPVRWGFIGAGFVASRALAPAVHAAAEAELTLSAARDVDRAAALEPRRVVASYEAVLEDPDVEVVYISLPNDAHHHWISAGLSAGKHVVCEKPLTLNAQECRDVQSLAESCGRLLLEATWTRWHPRHRRASALIASGDLGQIRSIDASFTFNTVPADNYRLDPARGGGALLDVGPYVLSAVTDWSPASWHVDCVERSTHTNGVDLRTEARMTSSDGAHACALASFVDTEQQGLQVTGSSLTLRWGDPAFTSWRAQSTLRLSSSTRHWDETFPACDAYQDMVSAISRHVRGDDSAYLPDPRLSQQVADLLEAVARTASTS